MNGNHIVRRIICVLLFVCAGGGLLCACQDQTPEPLSKPKTVRKKISVPVPGKKENLTIADASTPDSPTEKTEAVPEAGKPGKEESPRKVEEDEGKTPETKPVAPIADNKKEPETEKIETQEADSDAVAEEKEGSPADSEPADPNEDGDEDSDEITETIAGISSEEEGQPLLAVYNPKGKADPFEPLFKEKPKAPPEPEPKADDKAGKPKPPPRRLTPLEKLDLDQLKLVGIIRAESGNKALVEEASGKGYIIVKGTYVGIRSGIVVDILQDRVVVEEKDEDVLGKVTVRKRELKFNRPEGDDYYEM